MRRSRSGSLIGEWIAFNGGATIGTRGSGGGVILVDEEYCAGARITLERDGSIAPFEITCGVYGCVVHTRFFSGEDEARVELAAMKIALTQLLHTGIDSAAIKAFVERFPG